MAKEFLEGLDVVVVLKQLRGKGVSGGEAAGQRDNSRFSRRFLNGTLEWLDSLELEDAQFFRFSASAERQNLNPDDTAILTKVQNHAGLNFLRLDNLRLVQPEVKRIVLPVNFQSHFPFPKRRSKNTVTIR